jgi:hypothetical protein
MDNKANHVILNTPYFRTALSSPIIRFYSYSPIHPSIHYLTVWQNVKFYFWLMRDWTCNGGIICLTHLLMLMLTKVMTCLFEKLLTTKLTMSFSLLSILGLRLAVSPIRFYSYSHIHLSIYLTNQVHSLVNQPFYTTNFWQHFKARIFI